MPILKSIPVPSELSFYRLFILLTLFCLGGTISCFVPVVFWDHDNPNDPKNKNHPPDPVQQVDYSVQASQIIFSWVYGVRHEDDAWVVVCKEISLCDSIIDKPCDVPIFKGTSLVNAWRDDDIQAETDYCYRFYLVDQTQLYSAPVTLEVTAPSS